MKTAIILHGWPDKEEYFDPTNNPSPSNSHWFPWLKQQLSEHGISAETPEMPDAWEPRYEKWKHAFEQFPVNEETILIGHSCGGGFLIRWLTENNVKTGPVFLIAPWMDPSGEERESVGDFFDFTVDPNLSEKTDGITIFVSNDDEQSILDTVTLLENTLKEKYIERFEGKGHFTFDDMGTDEFPELLKQILMK